MKSKVSKWRTNPMTWIRFLVAIVVAFCIGLSELTVYAQAEKKPRVIVVRPNAWSEGLKDWIRYRSNEYHVVEVDVIPNPHALRSKLLETIQSDPTTVEAIVLCGDVVESTKQPADQNPRLPPTKIITPSFHLETSVKLGPATTPTLATDALFGDVDDDGCPEISVGRLPVQNAEELRLLLARSQEYETSQNLGPWRDDVHVTAGVGNFGFLADAAIETVARRYLSEGLPDRFRLHMTYASLTSPYCPDPFRLKKSYIDRINQGGLFWVYIGHGWIDRLDAFEYADQHELICGPEDTALFDVRNGAPIAILLACYTCAIDSKVDCFAKRLLSQKNGPIAVIGGSRVTMPYGLSQLAGEMIENAFAASTESNPRTLGRIFVDAKQSVWREDDSDESNSVTKEGRKLRSKYQVAVTQMAKALSPPDHSLLAERREHVRLMNLLGDPLLKIRQPKPIEVDGADTIEAGSDYQLRVQLPWDGRLQVELRLHRDQVPEGLKSVGRFDGSESQRGIMQSNYERANQLQLLSLEREGKKGELSVTIPIPATSRGKHVVWTRMQSDSDWAVGTKRITVKRAK